MNQDDFRQVCVLSGTDYNIQKYRDEHTSYDLYKVTNHFFNFLDDILLKYTDTLHQEYFVFRENNLLFFQ